MNVGDAARKPPVNFFRKRICLVVCPQPGFHVTYRDVPIKRCQTADERRRRISLHQHKVRGFLFKDFIQGGDRILRQ